MSKGSPIGVMERFLGNRAKRNSRVPASPAIGFSESRITQSCVRWFRIQYPQYAGVLIHPANEGARRTRVVETASGARVISTGGARLKAEGLVPGVADLLLLVPRKGFGCLAVEMKTPARSSRQSDRQVEWEKAVVKAGNRYVVCRSLEEFMAAVREYLE